MSNTAPSRADRWPFLLADGAHHKKPHSPTHPLLVEEPDILGEHGQELSETA